MNTLDVIKELLDELPEIESISFTGYPMQTLVQDTLDLSEDDKILVSAALKIRSNLWLPFWDSLMLSCFDKKNISTNLLKRALIHNKNVEILKTNEVSKVENHIISKPDENISLNSLVTLRSGITMHLFLVDFHIRPSINNLEIVSSVLKVLELHGYILNSGESYHFISNSLYDENGLVNLLAKSLLFSPIVDRAWIAHQLLERSCSLRVSKKHGLLPNLIKRV